MTALSDVVSSLQAVEATLAGVLAARDGLLALASRVALSMAAESGDGPDAADLTTRAVAAEIGAVQRVSDRTVQRRMAEAEWTVSRFPAVWMAQGAGRIGAGHTRVIVEAGAGLDDQADRDAFAARVLEFAEIESPNRLRPIARRLAEQYQPVSIQERHRDACRERRVWVTDVADGMSELGMLGPSTLVHGMFDRLTQMATTVAGTPSATDGQDHRDAESRDERTLSQTRADLLADLVLTGTPAGHDSEERMLGAITAQVQVTVPVLTLMGSHAGIDAPPAELDGRCPIDPATARRLAGSTSGWDRILTDPIAGGMLAVDRYRPSEHLKRRLKARDQRCRFMTCGWPARECDIDHSHDAAMGGRTREDNLADLCRRHHVLKHHSPWQVRQLGHGALEWTSPTGRVYIDEPPPQNTVVFTSGEPPPF